MKAIRIIPVLALAGALAAAAAGSDFYVSPRGDDGFSGSRASPNWRKTDGPFATVERALRAAVVAPRPVRIHLREGVYQQSGPLVITPQLSGLTLAAYRSEKPVISGGRVISGWDHARLNGREVWMAEVPEIKAGRWLFHQLWLDGQPLTRARHPDKGYFSIAEMPDKTEKWTDGQMRFGFAAKDLPAWNWTNGAEAVVMTRWVESRLPVTGFDLSERLISFGKRSVFQLSPGDLYYLEGALEAMDQPGEWALDSRAGKIYYAPRPGERLERFRPTAPAISNLLRFEGDLEGGAFVEDVSMKGLTFSHSEWYFPGGFHAGKDRPEVWPPANPEVGGFAQAAIGVPGAVSGQGVRNLRFENCRFTCLGNYAVEFSRGSSSNLFKNCEFSHLGAGGIRLGSTSLPRTDNELSRGNVITNCTIFDGGRLFHSAIGVWIGQSSENVLANNLIHDFYYTGVSIGWTWGYGPAAATNNLVAFNHVHHIGRRSDGDGPILSDMGGIYTLSMQPGTRILNNLWHDIAGFRYGGWGIYFDEGSSSILAESNVVYRTTHGGFHQHYGATNMVRNNIFAFARDHQVQRSRAEAHPSFTFINNIVYFNAGVLLGGNWSGDAHTIDYNLYFDSRSNAIPAEMKFAGASLGDWRARHHDEHSRVDDPLFLNPTEGDFRLQPRSPALTNSLFKPINLRQVGPQH